MDPILIAQALGKVLLRWFVLVHVGSSEAVQSAKGRCEVDYNMEVGVINSVCCITALIALKQLIGKHDNKSST